MKYDFDQIQRDNPLPDIVGRSQRLIKNGGEFLCLCPFHADTNPSLTLYKGKADWKFFCFSCGAHGDVIDYVRDQYGYATIGEAARWLMGEDPQRSALPPKTYAEVKDPYAGYSFGTPPADAPTIIAGKRTPALRNPKRRRDVHYTPKMVFPYRDAAGGPLGYVLRVEFDDKKITPGIWWMTGPEDWQGWSHGSYPSPRPVYGLDRLAARPRDQVLIVEGEKCADAACRVFSGLPIVPISWMGGAKAVKKTDWSVLAGRSVLVWPDQDDEGRKAALEIVAAAHKAGASRVKAVKVDRDLAKGWDVADAENEMGAQGVRDWLKSRIVEVKDGRERIEGPNSRERNSDNFRDGVGDSEGHAGRDREGAGGSPPRRNPENERRSDDGAGREQPDDRQVSGRPSPAAKETLPQLSGPTPSGRGASVDQINWREHLIMLKNGEGVDQSSQQNIMMMLQYEERFRGTFAWNSFANEVYLLSRPYWDLEGDEWTVRKIKDTDVTSCTGWLEYTGIKPKFNDVGRSIVRVAEHNKYNPVMDTLKSLKWDGVSRINGRMTDDGDTVTPWLSEYCGADDIEINRVFGEKWLISAVARALQPGCKVDTMLIFEGDQGIKKSTAIEVLASAIGPGLFTDEVSDPNSKDAAMQIHGRLIVEIAELNMLSRATVNEIKAWITRTADRFRRPYGKVIEEFPRTCVFVGTVNPLGDSGYLKDPTGARRFWPVMTTAIDVDKLRRDAPQLWAEALVMYRKGVKWWLDKAQEKLAIDAQKLRYEDDPWAETIDAFTSARSVVSLQEVLHEALGIPAERRNTLAARRVIGHLSRKGWRRTADDGRIVFKKEVLV